MLGNSEVEIFVASLINIGQGDIEFVDCRLESHSFIPQSLSVAKVFYCKNFASVYSLGLEIA